MYRLRLVRPIAPAIRPAVSLLICRTVSLLIRPAPLLISIWPVVYAHHVIIIVWVTGNIGQFSCIITVKTCRATRATACNSLVRVLLFVCVSVNYALRACITVTFYCRPKYVDRIIFHIYSTRPCRIIYCINAWALVGITLDVGSPWAGNITATAIGVSIIYYSCIAYNINHPGMRHIIIINIRAIDIRLGRKCPISIRHAVAAAK